MEKLTENFSSYEFADPVTGADKINLELVERLQDARNIYGHPITISSGVRSRGHNESIGGSPDSAHLDGMAADIAVNDSRERFLILRALFKAGFNRIGVDARHIHVDIDPSKIPSVLFLE